MQYNTANITVSLTQELARYVRAHGYEVLWYSTNEVVAHTGGGASLGQITFVSAYPAEPRFISRLKGESAGKDDILAPALALYTSSGPSRVRSQGLGHLDSEWSRQFVIEAVTETDAQQRALMDLLHVWLMDTPNVVIPCYDYSNPLAPVLLAPVYVEEATVDAIRIPQPFDAAQYLIRVDGSVFYFE